MLDDQLISALKRGEQPAFLYLVQAYQHMVYNTALGIIQNDRESEDVAQEVFIQVIGSIKQFKGESKLSTWLYRITVTKSLDRKRKMSRKKRFAVVQSLFGMGESAEADIPDFQHPGVIAENKERSAILFRAINKLPDKQKTAFVLNKVEGQSYNEVAEIMGVSAGAVESYLHRAKQNLRGLLEDYYYERY